MRVLISAYACKPNVGSEAGVGWHWVRRLLERGWDVTLLTSMACKPHLEEASAESNPNLEIIYVDVPYWPISIPRGGFAIYVYYILWQWFAYLAAANLHRERLFNVVHQLTWGSVRFPSFLGRLNVYFLLGPLGGAESAPFALRAGYTIKGWAKDLLRDVSNILSRFDPLIRQTFHQADVILLKTEDNRPFVPRRDREKIFIRSEIGIDVMPGKPVFRSPKRILFAGRTVYWKGIDILAEAFAVVVKRYPDAHLTIAGAGADFGVFKALAQRLRIEKNVTLLGWVPKERLNDIYKENGVFLFPSLHDSSGNVVLEALAHGLPVVCLDIGGPASLLDEASGIIVPCSGASRHQVIGALSNAIERLIVDRGFYESICDGAFARAKKLSWESAVDKVYDENIDKIMNG